MRAPGDRWPWLPALLMDMAREFGLDVALAFAAEHGGTILYVPMRATPGHPVAQRFGVAVLDWLIAYYDRTPTLQHRQLTVPMGPSQSLAQREAAVRQLTAQGWRRNQIARRLGVHVRTVAAIRARQREAEGAAQLTLFDPPQDDRR